MTDQPQGYVDPENMISGYQLGLPAKDYDPSAPVAYPIGENNAEMIGHIPIRDSISETNLSYYKNFMWFRGNSSDVFQFDFQRESLTPVEPANQIIHYAGS